MYFNETPLPHQEAFDYALFRFEHSIKLMIAHPDWSAADINEVAENMWLERNDTTSSDDALESSDDALESFDEQLALFDREEARAINRELS
jgi:hypothetical protein